MRALVVVAALVCADDRELNEVILLQLRARGDILNLNTATNEVASSVNSSVNDTGVAWQQKNGKVCQGSAYTAAGGRRRKHRCDGWKGLSKAGCQTKCEQNVKAKNCPQKTCVAAAFYPKNGWCHLYDKCDVHKLKKRSTATLLIKPTDSEPDDSDVPDSDEPDAEEASGGKCVDTPGWKNPAKKTCHTYKQKKWCKDGKVKQKWTVGERWNFPEKNCCVCGKGADADDSDADDSDAADVVDSDEDEDTQEVEPDPADCKKDWVAQKGKAMKNLHKSFGMHFKEMKKAMTKSKQTFSCLKNKWCHTGSGGLVSSAGATTYTWGCVADKGSNGGEGAAEEASGKCVDTPGWKNPAKKTCHTYKQKKWCKDGKVKQQGTVGARWNFPEKNCCVCGKGAAGDEGDSDEGDGNTQEIAEPDPADCKKDWKAQNGKAFKNLIKSYGMHFKEMKKFSASSKKAFSCLKNKWCHHGSGGLVSSAGATTYTWGCV